MSARLLFRFAASSVSALIVGLCRVLVRSPVAAARDDGRFRCVSIRPCAAPCPEVLQLAERRYLPNEAPGVPLPGCPREPAGGAGCVYRHHDDRRHHDRRHDFGCGVEPLMRDPAERRRQRGRRRSDGADAVPRAAY